MKRGHRERNRPLWPWLLAALALAAAAVFLLRGCGKTTPLAPDAQTAQTAQQIAIPGYEALELKADQKKQTLCLPNPETNDCYFRISLYLADDTLLWQSGLIKPGKTSATITFTAEVVSG